MNGFLIKCKAKELKKNILECFRNDLEYSISENDDEVIILRKSQQLDKLIVAEMR